MTRTSRDASPASYRSVFAVAEFRNLWVAHLLSVAGDQLARVALTVLVFDRTRSAGVAAGFGVSGALLADAGTFVRSATVIGLGIRRHLPVGEAKSRPGWWRTTTAGLRIVASHPQLRLLVGFACLSGFFVVPEGLAVP